MRRWRRQRTGGGELGCRVEDTTDHEGEDKIAAAIAAGAKNTVEADVARGAENRHDMAVR